MILSKVMERLYVKIYIGVVVSAQQTSVVVETFKGKVRLQRLNKTLVGEEVLKELEAFVAEQISDSPLYYVALLDNSEEQGALPCCSMKEAQEYTDLSTAMTHCIDKKWMVYTSKPELDALMKRYRSIGPDFVFSPFAVLTRFFKDKIAASVPSLYVLIGDDAVTTAIFENSEMKFGLHEKVQFHVPKVGAKSEEGEFEEGTSGDEVSVALDDLDPLDLMGEDETENIDDLDAIEELDDLTSLDDIEEFEDFALDEVEEESRGESESELEEEMDMERFGLDYQRFHAISNALNVFYSDSRYENQFIETVYIADGTGVGDELKRFLEEELFLSVYIRKMELVDEVTELAIEEAAHAL